MDDLGKILYDLHWDSVKKQFPNEDYEFVTSFEQSDEVIKATWRETAQKFAQHLNK